MPRVTVTCPECDAKIKLKSKSELGEERPCQVCGVVIELTLESNEETYALNMTPFGGGKSERSKKKPRKSSSTVKSSRRETSTESRSSRPQPSRAQRPKSRVNGQPPMLKRGMYRELNGQNPEAMDDFQNVPPRRESRRGSGDNFFADNAKLIAVGIVVSVLFGVGISIWLPSAIAPNTPPTPAADSAAK